MTQIIPSRGGGGGVGLYKYMGTVDYYEDLPTSGMKVGDTYNVVNAHTTAPEFPAGANLAWNGEEWDVLGGNFDLSEYQKKLVEGDGIDIDQDTNEISVESSIIEGAAAGATAVQPGDDVSTLNNDAGYIDNTVDDLTYYTKTSDLAAVALSNDYDDLIDKPTIGNATLTIQRNGTNVNTFTANATSNVTANISVPTKTSDITNDSGFIDKDVNNLTNYTLTTSLASVATSGSYNDLSNKPSIPTKTSDLNNDSGFIDKDVNNLTNYTLSSDLASVATSGSYNDLSNKPTIGDATIKIQKNSTDIDSFTTNATSGKTINIPVPTTVAELSDSSDYALNSSLAAVATSGSYNDLSSKPTIGTANLTIQKNGTTVATFGANATSGVTANITVPTKVTDLSDGGDYVKSASLATVATTGDYDDLIDKPTIPGVINNLTSTSTTDALSAAQGKALKDALDNISGLGKFLSLWNSTTGQPISFPLSTPYTYTTGDWFMVETVGATNYKPNGSSYTGTASTTVESGTVKQGDVYIYDGTSWLLQVNNEPQVSFSDIAGQPTDNSNLATALGNKQDVANMVTTLSGADNTHYPTAKAVADALSGAGNGDMLKATYDPNNVEANAFDYNNFINTPSLAAVATSGAYSDLSGTPTLASVATSGSYNDLSNKPTIPAAQIQSDWTQADNTKKDYIKNKPSLATVATSGLYSDLSGTPTLATVATSGSYNDLSNKPTIPTVNNATLTIQKNGTTVKTFTANASSDVTANISVPTKTSDITNDSGYITKSVNDLTNYTLSSALATVATTGSYSDLSNKPTIPTDTSDLTNGAGFITGITSGDVTTALGYTPANDNSVVKTSGNQTIAGTKTFSTSPVVPSKTTDATNTGTAIATEAQVYLKANASDVNTKTFYLSGTSDLTTAQAAYDWYKAGKNPIVVYSGDIYLFNTNNTANSYIEFYWYADSTVTVGNVSPLRRYYVKITYNSSNIVTQISTGNKVVASFLATDVNYTTPYTPTYNGSPATKKYVDDGLSGKQATLVSGTNIKTINNTSLLGSGNIDIQSGGNYTAGNGIDITNDEIGLDGTYDGGTYNDYSAMQGPCPAGFHVPLRTERQALYNAGESLGLRASSSGAINCSTYLKLPFAGRRDYHDGSYKAQSTNGYYWSSSHESGTSWISYYFYIYGNGGVTPQDSQICTDAYSIRCFKDSPVEPDDSWTKIYDGSSVASGAGIFHNTTLGLISLSGDGTTWYTIQDKNLGATQVYNYGDTLSEANCGKYYQWGNNYGFPRTGTVTTSSTRVDASNYGPGNYYSGSTFIFRTSNPRGWYSGSNHNLWGGETGVVQRTISGNLVVGDKLYKIVTSTTAPASGTASNIITIVTD